MGISTPSLRGAAAYAVLHAALAIAELDVRGEVDYPIGCVVALERAAAAKFVGVDFIIIVVMMMVMVVPVSFDNDGKKEWNGGKSERSDLHG